MQLLQILLFFLVFTGIYSLLLILVKAPSKKSRNTIHRAFANYNKQISEELLHIATKLSPYILMNEYKEKEMAVKLRMAGIGMNPKTYKAKALLKSLTVLLFLPMFKLFDSGLLQATVASGIVIVSILLYASDWEKIESAMKKKKEAIEWELPRFCQSILQEFRHHRDIVRILENYKSSASKTFAEELEITIASMRMGNIQTALLMLDARLGLASMSAIVRGLVAVSEGDDGIFYFQMLEHDLRNLEYQKQKREVVKRQGKVLKYSFLILGGVIAIYMVMFALQFTGTLQNLMK